MSRKILTAVISIIFLAGCAAPGHYGKGCPRERPRAMEKKAPYEYSRVVVIDPGHGGKDPGATGPTGLKEKDVVLDIARCLQKQLQMRGACRVVLTRDDDTFISLVGRREVAVKEKADLFISIHCDGNRNRRWSGTTVYILSEKGAKIARSRAIAEEDINAKGYLKEIVVDLVQQGSQRESYKFAELSLEKITRELGTKNLGIKYAAFGILKTLEVPSVLVETAFISNWWEEKLLKQPMVRERIARALADSVSEYFAAAF